MELIEVAAFVAVSRAGSFTRAAERLHLSQPAISRRIDLLERELGAPLFARTREGARLNEAGLAFLPFAEQVLAAAGDGAAAVQALARDDQGTVSLALVGTLASSQLVTRLQAFRAAHPATRLALRTARSDEVSALVRQGEVALGLRYFADPSPEIVSIPVLEEELVVVCAGDSRLVPAGADVVSDLRDVPWVGFPVAAGSSGEPFARLLERQLLVAGLDGAEMLAVDSLTAQKRLIEADFGIGLLPVSAIEEEERLGTLRVLPIPALHCTAPVSLIYRRAGYLSAAARRLMSALTGDPAVAGG